MRAQKRTMLVKKINAELDIERLTDIMANDFILQDEADELKETIDKIEKERSKNGRQSKILLYASERKFF